MSDLSEYLNFTDAAGLREAWARGMAAFAVPEPVRMSDWMQQHFYLSAESSYGEGQWTPWPFQLAIINTIGNDDVVEVNIKKSARVGYTKILGGAVGYFAHHKRRNQALWQPTDDDRDQYVKTELDPMLRDVDAMRAIMPNQISRHKDNTIKQKSFLGSVLHLLGGKAAKNYRRISIDCAYLDEIDGFDRDIEKEGDPATLAYKRVSGATFPKFVVGSTPTVRGFSLIEDRVELADQVFRGHIPCPHCGGWHPLHWGIAERPGTNVQDEDWGMTIDNDDPETVRHVCPHCHGSIDQAGFLAIAHRIRYQSQDGTIVSNEGDFFDRDGNPIPAPRHIAFDHVWAAYAPNVTWAGIARDYLGARAKYEAGDPTKLKTFTNLTLGRTWGGEIESTEASELRARAEPNPIGIVPHGGLLLLAGVDLQDNRIEVGVWAVGRGRERWPVQHRILYGNPAENAVWAELDDYLFNTEFHHASGTLLRIHAVAMDTGGHNTHEAYEFCRIHKTRRVCATKGRSGSERAIKDGGGAVDIDLRGRKRKNGVILWQIGTNLAKDAIHNALAIERPGPNYIHFAQELSDEWFAQLTAEVRATVDTAAGSKTRWVKRRKRNEVLDCLVGVIWLEHHLELHRKSDRWWDELESRVQPAVLDLFTPPAPGVPPQPISRQPGGRVDMSKIMQARK